MSNLWYFLHTFVDYKYLCVEIGRAVKNASLSVSACLSTIRVVLLNPVAFVLWSPVVVFEHVGHWRLSQQLDVFFDVRFPDAKVNISIPRHEAAISDLYL